MNDKKKTLFAILAVALMLAVPLTVISSTEESEAASVVPKGSHYTYKITYNTATSQITAVYKDGSNTAETPVDLVGKGLKSATEINGLTPASGDIYKVSEAGSLNSGALEVSAGDTVWYNGTAWALYTIPSTWSWSSTTGLGPFNMFYAAISTGQSDGGALSEEAGHVAYILDPADLTKAVKGKTITSSTSISSELSKYNIMLVIPTVYWYSDGEGSLYISDTNDNSKLAVDINSKMKAYAHQVDDSTVYPYLAIGVYEANVDAEYGLMSKTGTVAGVSKRIDEFRDEVDKANTKVEDGCGTYQLWNFYEWTLYKILAQTIIGSKDAQSKIGAGYDASAGGTGPVNSGQGNTKGAYSASVSEIKSESAYSKLLIENAWGSVWEFVDNTYLKNGALYAGSALTNSLSSGNLNVSGAEYVPTGTRITVPASMSQNDITEQSLASSTWDVPTAGSGKSTPPVGASSDSIWTNNGQNSVLVVGGSWSDGASAGLSAWSSHNALSVYSTRIGARLAYLMTADAAGTTTYKVTFNESAAGRVTTITVNPGEPVLLPAAAGAREKTCGGWYSDEGCTQEFIGPEQSYFTPVGSVTLYAKYTDYATIRLNDGTSDIGTIKRPVGVTMGLPSAPGKSGKVLENWYGSYTAGNYSDKLGPEGGSYYVTGDATIYAKYVDASDLFTIQVYKGDNTPTTVTVDYTTTVEKGRSMVLPYAAEIQGYTMDGWYKGASGSLTTLVGMPGQLYTPTDESTLAPKYTAITSYTVTFKIWDGSGQTEGDYAQDYQRTVAANEYIELPNAKHYDDHVLKYWASDCGGTTQIGTAGQMYKVTANVSLYPIYGLAENGLTYSVTIMDASLSGSSVVYSDTNADIVKVQQGSSIRLPAAPELSGKVFDHWSTYTTSVQSDDIGISGQFYQPTAAVKIAPVYADAVTITIDKYKSASPYYETDYTVKAASGTQIVLPTAAVRDGYELIAWTTTYNDGSTTVGAPGSYYTVSTDQTLYPYYSETSASGYWTVMLYAKNGIDHKDVIVSKGYPLMLPGGDKEDGFAFSGWATKSGEDYTPVGTAGQYYTPTGNVSLYSRYSAVESSAITLAYTKNGEASDAPGVVAYITATLSGSTVYGDGYVYLSIVKTSAISDYTVSATNSYVVPITDGLYRLYLKSDGASTVTIAVVTDFQTGYSSFNVAGIANQGRSVQINMAAAGPAGLADGDMKLGGVYCRYNDTLGKWVYGSIENLDTTENPGLVAQTVTGGSFSGTFTLKAGLSVYYAYGIYTPAGGSPQYCGGMIGPAAPTLENVNVVP